MTDPENASWRSVSLVSLVVVSLAPACARAPADERGTADYAAVTLEGDSVSLADLRGEVVLLNVWATWCAPCRVEIPVLQDLHERRVDAGLRVIGVSVDDATARDDVRRFADELGMTYPIWLDPGERVSSKFLLHGIPSTVMIGRDGRERWRKIGPVEPADPTLHRMLAAALAEPTPENGGR